ncbi:hypothetical protein SK128_002945 [Halocaridina rubra]|uniref:Uncharacterized protein n=1 Tax=Halocaridina rubra TaxID=373956 RepID=A0AAN9A2J1_HALRR
MQTWLVCVTVFSISVQGGPLPQSTEINENPGEQLKDEFIQEAKALQSQQNFLDHANFQDFPQSFTANAPAFNTLSATRFQGGLSPQNAALGFFPRQNIFPGGFFTEQGNGRSLDLVHVIHPTLSEGVGSLKELGLGASTFDANNDNFFASSHQNSDILSSSNNIGFRGSSIERGNFQAPGIVPGGFGNSNFANVRPGARTQLNSNSGVNSHGSGQQVLRQGDFRGQNIAGRRFGGATFGPFSPGAFTGNGFIPAGFHPGQFGSFPFPHANVGFAGNVPTQQSRVIVHSVPVVVGVFNDTHGIISPHVQRQVFSPSGGIQTSNLDGGQPSQKATLVGSQTFQQDSGQSLQQDALVGSQTFQQDTGQTSQQEVVGQNTDTTTFLSVGSIHNNEGSNAISSGKLVLDAESNISDTTQSELVTGNDELEVIDSVATQGTGVAPAEQLSVDIQSTEINIGDQIITGVGQTEALPTAKALFATSASSNRLGEIATDENNQNLIDLQGTEKSSSLSEHTASDTSNTSADQENISETIVSTATKDNTIQSTKKTISAEESVSATSETPASVVGQAGALSLFVSKSPTAATATEAPVSSGDSTILTEGQSSVLKNIDHPSEHEVFPIPEALASFAAIGTPPVTTTIATAKTINNPGTVQEESLVDTTNIPGSVSIQTSRNRDGSIDNDITTHRPASSADIGSAVVSTTPLSSFVESTTVFTASTEISSTTPLPSLAKAIATAARTTNINEVQTSTNHPLTQSSRAPALHELLVLPVNPQQEEAVQNPAHGQIIAATGTSVGRLMRIGEPVSILPSVVQARVEAFESAKRLVQELASRQGPAATEQREAAATLTTQANIPNIPLSNSGSKEAGNILVSQASETGDLKTTISKTSLGVEETTPQFQATSSITSFSTTVAPSVANAVASIKGTTQNSHNLNQSQIVLTAADVPPSANGIAVGSLALSVNGVSNSLVPTLISTTPSSITDVSATPTLVVPPTSSKGTQTINLEKEVNIKALGLSFEAGSTSGSAPTITNTSGEPTASQPIIIVEPHSSSLQQQQADLATSAGNPITGFSQTTSQKAVDLSVLSSTSRAGPVSLLENLSKIIGQTIPDDTVPATSQTFGNTQSQSQNDAELTTVSPPAALTAQTTISSITKGNNAQNSDTLTQNKDISITNLGSTGSGGSVTTQIPTVLTSTIQSSTGSGSTKQFVESSNGIMLGQSAIVPPNIQSTDSVSPVVSLSNFDITESTSHVATAPDHNGQQQTFSSSNTLGSSAKPHPGIVTTERSASEQKVESLNVNPSLDDRIHTSSSIGTAKSLSSHLSTQLASKDEIKSFQIPTTTAKVNSDITGSSNVQNSKVVLAIPLTLLSQQTDGLSSGENSARIGNQKTGTIGRFPNIFENFSITTDPQEVLRLVSRAQAVTANAAGSASINNVFASNLGANQLSPASGASNIISQAQQQSPTSSIMLKSNISSDTKASPNNFPAEEQSHATAAKAQQGTVNSEGALKTTGIVQQVSKSAGNVKEVPGTIKNIQEGLQTSTNIQEGLEASKNIQEGVQTNTNIQEGVQTNTNIQEGLQAINTEQSPLSITIKHQTDALPGQERVVSVVSPSGSLTFLPETLAQFSKALGFGIPLPPPPSITLNKPRVISSAPVTSETKLHDQSKLGNTLKRESPH